ncbi:putative oxalyl-CoA decarboxylase domain protein [Mycobacterium kansasii]|uniref:Putative oxalyl-CoA decarboxylase domain protein n=1 Tax=Mycobacterium kansasii TaxID=1768 RepID=A0A1V3WWE2_MYCKA|nr:putative oxalyl-CoA decarboxylase domain protein [Mycobacterium kansasii]
MTVVILNNGGVYRGDEASASGSDPAPTVLNARARHELIAEAFSGKGYHVTTPAELTAALTEALASGDRRSSIASSARPPGWRADTWRA